MTFPSPFPSKLSPSPYVEKLASAPPDYLLRIPNIPHKTLPYKPSYYFFYGTLSDPNKLKEILKLPELPELRNAQLVGYSLAWWGQYRALVDGPPGNIVTGSVFLVPSKEDEDRLAYYETDAYEVKPCAISVNDDQEPRTATGKTFKYAGDAAALDAKKFDKELWEKRMGIALPKSWNQKATGGR